MYEEERTFVKATKVKGIDTKQAERLLFGETIQLAAGSKLAMELDAGELTTGYLTVGVRGGRGGVIRLLCSECTKTRKAAPCSA